VTKIDSPDPVAAGANLTYTIIVQNNGPDAATSVTLTDVVPTGTTFVSLTAPAGWTSTTPAVNAGGTVSATNPSMAVGIAVFTLVVNVNSALVGGNVSFVPITNTATVATTSPDPSNLNNTATQGTTVIAQSDLMVTKSDLTDPVAPGGNIVYFITVHNNGPSGIFGASMFLAEATPPGTTFVAMTPPAGWGCMAPAPGGTGTITCGATTLAAGASANFTFVVKVNPSATNGSTITNAASVGSSVTDPNLANNAATETTTVSTTPTAVRMRSLTAKRSPGGVVVRWRTASEVDALGFNVYGELRGKRLKLNRHLIVARSAGGASYSFRYRATAKRAPTRFWLQAVNLDGSRAWYGAARIEGVTRA